MLVGKARLACDWDTTESQPCLDVQDVFHEMRRGQHDRIRDEPILVPLDGTNHSSLSFRRLVMVNDTQSPQKLQYININYKHRHRHDGQQPYSQPSISPCRLP